MTILTNPDFRANVGMQSHPVFTAAAGPKTLVWPISLRSSPAINSTTREWSPNLRPDLSGRAGLRVVDVNRETMRIQQIAEWLKLFVQSSDVIELRALNASTLDYRKPHTESGFFDFEHLDVMADAAFRLTHDSQGVYFTLNPIKPDVLARRFNRVEAAMEDTARDVDIERRCRLLIDADPVRIAGVSATDVEKSDAAQVILRVRDFLRDEGWPDPIFADSGNGFHLLYDVDLPVDDGELVKRVLAALAVKFDTPAVKIDRSVFNPSRIVKLYGTMARKGDSIPDRPHRWTAVLEVPTKRGKVPIELMEKLADANRPVEKQTPTTPQREWQGPQNQSTVSSRARAYLDKMPGAVAGESGHNRTYTAANVLIRGFGIPVVDALPILKEWNEKCQPPWTEKELLHKLEDAGREGGPRGYLLGTSSPGKVLAGSGFQPDFLDSTAFDNLAIEHEWLIKKALVAKQPAVVGGPKKVLKTSLMIDLAVSLGSGQRFLNHFDVPKRLRVLVLSGESGKAAIQNTARRICKAKGISLSQCNIFWGFSLPWLSSDLDLSMLGTGIIENGIEVVIIDPLYLCLLAGNAGLQASNVYQMGPLLLAAARTCLDAGATPILVHHTTKMSQPGRGDNHEPLELDNLAFAGVAEFARQWIIVSRRERFDPDAGDHKLWLNVGGSAGHCGLYGVDIREGILNDRFSGREWLVAVQSATNARAAVAKAKREQKEADKRARDVDDREKVLRVLALFPNGETTKVIGEEAGIGSRVVGVLLELMKNLEVVCTTVHKPCGRNPAMSFKGWRLWRPGEKPLMTTDQSDRLRRGEPVEAVLDTVACGGPEVDSQAGLDGG